MTVIEQKTMTAIQSINRKMRDQREPDWEQRRYEIAKEIFTRCLSSSDGDMRAFCNRELEMTASDCVSQAKALITALKKDGVNYFEERNPDLCKNCKRHIPWSTPVEDSLTWTAPQYDEKTGKCPLHEPKPHDNEQS